ncbi:MAG: outer membrane protein assembly factor BamA [Spirochaetia bacterium]|nr:outer membrane protein assembly factor BamA [Spirochaetia bacterium]
MMHRKLTAFLFFILIPFFSLAAQESEDWYMNKPITKIEFEGLKNVKKSDISGIVSSYVGEPFTIELYETLYDRLYALDLFEDIVPYAKHDSKPDTVLLVFQFKERPVISSINFTGNKKIRNNELKDQINIKTSDVYVEGKVLIDERTLRNYYLQKGYTASKISHSVSEKDGEVTVTFHIDEGSTTIITGIHFIGNTIVSERSLKGKLESKEAGFLRDGAYQSENLEKDKLTILNYYKERGYIDVNLLDVKVDTNYNEEKSRYERDITFVIQEGAQYTYTGLTINGCEVFSADELYALVKLKPGSVYNDVKFQEGLSNIAGKYYENGYMSNEFYPIPLKDTELHEISYKLSIKESVRSHVENIIIKGNTKTKDFVILREIPIESGDIFSREKIITALRNLMNLQYFSNVVPDYQSGSEANLVDLVFTVEEQSTTSVQFGATFSAVSDPDTIPVSLYAKLENSNLMGEGKSISASTTISNTELSLDFGYSQSWIGNLPISYAQSLSFAHKKTNSYVNMWTPNCELSQLYYYMNYEGWTTSLNTSLGRRWVPDFAILSLAGGLSDSLSNYIYDENQYVPVDQAISIYANRWGLTNSIWSSFSIDGRDINYDPSKGYFASEKLSWYGLIPVLEKEFFLRSDTKLEGYLTLFNIPVTENWSLKTVLAEYFGVSLLFPVSDTLTDSNRLYIDGVLNGRGWTDIYKYRGQVMLCNKLELRMPIVPGMLGIDLFWDAAAIKGTIKDIQNLKLSDVYFSMGPAVKILMPQFPLHLMFAFKYKFDDNYKFAWDEDPFKFVLSFNLVNR